MTNTPVILVVDDSKVSRMMTSAFIKDRFPEAVIHEAPDGQSGLKAMDTHHPDLVILDMNMPIMSGLEVAEIAIVRHPEMILALLTANVQESTRAKADDIGIQFFRKPINANVINAILDLLGVTP